MYDPSIASILDWLTILGFAGVTLVIAYQVVSRSK